jgi:hypothetical protein
MGSPFDSKSDVSAGSRTAAVIASEQSERGNLDWIAAALRASRLSVCDCL